MKANKIGKTELKTTDRINKKIFVYNAWLRQAKSQAQKYPIKFYLKHKKKLMMSVY